MRPRPPPYTSRERQRPDERPTRFALLNRPSLALQALIRPSLARRVSVRGCMAAIMLTGREAVSAVGAAPLLQAAQEFETVAANQNLTLAGGTGQVVQTYANTSAGSAQALNVTNNYASTTATTPARAWARAR